MSDKKSFDENLKSISEQIESLNKNIVLIYAFNGTGKTRLSIEYKDLTKANNGGRHAGVYYNAYSEDLFYWQNDAENIGEEIRLMVLPSSLNQYHSALDETKLNDKLSIYKPQFDYKFNYYKEDAAKGIESISFYPKVDKAAEGEEPDAIKISRGEEQVFIWCFFLTLFDINGWTGEQNSHFFIDDPVSSLDEHNIFITASTLMDLIDNHFEDRKIIITTHHVGFFAILSDWLGKGEKSQSYKSHLQQYILKNDGNELKLVSCRKDVFLYHLELLQILQIAVNEKKLYAYHFGILRQILENVSSFLGVGRIGYVLEQIGVDDVDTVSRIVNTLSHKTVFRYEAKELVPDNEELFLDVFNRLKDKYNFVIHVGGNDGK